MYGLFIMQCTCKRNEIWPTCRSGGKAGWQAAGRQLIRWGLTFACISPHFAAAVAWGVKMANHGQWPSPKDQQGRGSQISAISLPISSISSQQEVESQQDGPLQNSSAQHAPPGSENIFGWRLILPSWSKSPREHQLQP